MASVTGTARAFFIAAAGAAAIVASAPASAATFTLNIGPGTDSTFFGNSSKKSGTINDIFEFTVPAGSVSSFVGSIALSNKLDVTLTSVKLDSIDFNKDLTGPEERWTLNGTTIAGGLHKIYVQGTWGTSGGSYSGTLNFDAVPEPATWGLMILGFGAIGGAMRRRQSVKARVAFA